MTENLCYDAAFFSGSFGMPDTHPRADIEMLEVERILAGMSGPSRALLAQLSLHTEIDSTNAEALRRIAAGAGAGLVCIAEQQTAGRGRRGRRWISPFASNLYLSLVWEFAGGSAAAGGLSLAVGVAVTDALQRCGVTNLQLKWPNDILCGTAKLGGILVEIVESGTRACQLVVGVGINVQMPAAAAAAIDQDWTDIVSVTGSAPGRNHLLACLLDELLPLLASFETTGFGPWRQRWLERDAYAGKSVLVQSGALQLEGTASGINEQGALLLRVGETMQALHGGEVSLRAAP